MGINAKWRRLKAIAAMKQKIELIFFPPIQIVVIPQTSIESQQSQRQQNPNRFLIKEETRGWVVVTFVQRKRSIFHHWLDLKYKTKCKFRSNDIECEDMLN